MAEVGVLVLSEWWDPEAAQTGEGGVRTGLEVERDGDEIQVTLRGLDGDGHHGSFYLSVDNADALAGLLRAAMREEP